MVLESLKYAWDMTKTVYNHRTNSNWFYPVSNQILNNFLRQLNKTIGHAAKAYAEERILTFNNA